MNYYLLISLVLSLLSVQFYLYRQFQMLQQNSYFPSRYTKWLKENPSVFSGFAFLVSSVLFSFKLYFIQMLFIAFYLGWQIKNAVTIHKTAIKKLVFTGRIKRLYSASVIIPAIMVLLYVVFGQSTIGALACIFGFFICFIGEALVYLCWAVTLPIEKAFSRYYINDAKKILKNHSGLKVVGITGSYGKTSTKFILSRILSEKYNVVCTPQSFNTPMGVVRTVRESLENKTQIFVCEMGAKNIGDIKDICDIVNPDIALITSVGAQHLETFKTQDNVFKTKFELADAVSEKGGKIFVNGDSNGIISRIEDGKYTVYGTGDGFDYQARNISYTKNGCEFEMTLGTQTVKLSSRLLGLHNLLNIAGAAALAFELGVSADEIRFAVASLKPTEHRLELKNSVAGSLLIDDAYNANPEGSIEAVRVLGSFDGMKKVIITPGLIELGEKEYECNYALGLEAAKVCDIIILVGQNRSKPMTDALEKTKFDKQKLFIVKSFAEAMEIYSQFADNETVVLIENDLPDNYLN